MIYGNAEIDGVPWESLIKSFRGQLGEGHFDTVSAYADRFTEFLSKHALAFPHKRQDETVRYIAAVLSKGVVDGIKAKVRDHLKSAPLTSADEKDIIDATIKEYEDKWSESEFLEGFADADELTILTSYGATIEEEIKEAFQALPLEPTGLESLKKSCSRVFCRRLYPFPTSGVVIAGFGDKEMFPALVDLQIRCAVADRVRIGQRNVTDVEKGGASIVPLAQRETVEAFIEGVNPRFHSLIRSFLEQILSDFPTKILKDNPDWQNLPGVDRLLISDYLKAASTQLLQLINSQLQNYISREHVMPMLNTVEMLPKDELASMAEALVNLTAFKQRVSMDTETVGGPIDVAVISKGDGFVWIKRKHYFAAELNPQFFAKYNKRESTI